MDSYVPTKSRRQTIPGGFVLPRCWQLYAAFWCYRQGHLTLRAVRSWMALYEVQARRCKLKRGQLPRLRSSELIALLGGTSTPRGVRSDVRLLRSLGLVTLKDGRISFPDSLELLQVPGREQLEEQLKSLPNARRRVPLPRRIVRFLAGAGTRALFAVTLGEAMRLLYYKAGVVTGRGRSKASWLAKTFGIDLRSVKRARAHLEELGIIQTESETTGYEHVLQRRWGRVGHWNLEWDAASECTGLSPLVAESDTGLSPPESDKTLSNEKKNQNPALRGPAPGFFRKKVSEQKGPTMVDITEADLVDNERTELLLEDAIERGLIERSDSARLRFFALAEHARRYGTKNRPGLLRALLSKKRWFITQDDEDLARLRLKQLEKGSAEPQETRDRGGEGVPLADVLGRILASMKPAQQGVACG